MKVGEKVMQLLQASGHTQIELAKAIGAPQQTVNGWKQQNRNPTTEYIVPICRFLGITPNELFDYGEVDYGIDDEEQELLEMFRRLDRKGRRAVLHEADVQDDRVRIAGDSASADTA